MAREGGLALVAATLVFAATMTTVHATDRSACGWWKASDLARTLHEQPPSTDLITEALQCLPLNGLLVWFPGLWRENPP